MKQNDLFDLNKGHSSFPIRTSDTPNLAESLSYVVLPRQGLRGVNGYRAEAWAKMPRRGFARGITPESTLSRFLHRHDTYNAKNFYSHLTVDYGKSASDYLCVAPSVEKSPDSPPLRDNDLERARIVAFAHELAAYFDIKDPQTCIPQATRLLRGWWNGMAHNPLRLNGL